MAQEHADIIYSGGTILPLTGCDATLEAVAVKDGVILACGSRADVEKLAPSEWIWRGARCFRAFMTPTAISSRSARGD